MRRVETVPYDPSWPTRFHQSASELRRALGPNVLDVYHIGSMAVPGLQAKPVLDLLLVAADLNALDQSEPVWQRLGYVPRGENGLAGRRYFVREREGRRTKHVHAYATGDPSVARHLVFRDYLRAHPDE